jgi:hypothetical protein
MSNPPVADLTGLVAVLMAIARGWPFHGGAGSTDRLPFVTAVLGLLWNLYGFRGFVSLGHTHAVYVPPPAGGLFLDQEAVDAITGGPFLIDHDQKLAAW